MAAHGFVAYLLEIYLVVAAELGALDVGCTSPAPYPQDMLDFPCTSCSEAYYVENYGRLTQAEWTFLEPQVQDYNTALLARYGIDATDFLTPIEMGLRGAPAGTHDLKSADTQSDGGRHTQSNCVYF